MWRTVHTLSVRLCVFFCAFGFCLVLTWYPQNCNTMVLRSQRGVSKKRPSTAVWGGSPLVHFGTWDFHVSLLAHCSCRQLEKHLRKQPHCDVHFFRDQSRSHIFSYFLVHHHTFLSHGGTMRTWVDTSHIHKVGVLTCILLSLRKTSLQKITHPQTSFGITCFHPLIDLLR